MRTPKDNPEMNPVRDILGIAAERANHYWRSLPASIRAYYDMDDMISDCVLQVFKSAGKYDPMRARPTTFIWWVTNNCCLTIISKTKTGKRGGEYVMTSLSEIPRSLEDAGNLNLDNVLIAKGSVEALISRASRECRDFLEALLLGHTEAIRNQKGIQEELTYLIREVELPPNSFELVRAYLATC